MFVDVQSFACSKMVWWVGLCVCVWGGGGGGGVWVWRAFGIGLGISGIVGILALSPGSHMFRHVSTSD